ncbi:MAG: CHASE domain-containing protein [Chthoniobacter sp.]
MSDPTAPPRKTPALLALALGTLLSVLVAGLLHDWERREAQEQVRQVAQDRAEVLRGQIMRSMEVLHAIASLYETRGEVTRAEFGRFVADALARQPELQALAWDPRVPGAERDAWEQRAHDEGFAGFHFTEEKAMTRSSPPSLARNTSRSSIWKPSRKTPPPLASTWFRTAPAARARAGAGLRAGDRHYLPAPRPGTRLATRFPRLSAAL